LNTNKRKGLHYETVARDYLQQQGLIFLQQNFHSRFGEIDLIMRDSDMVCFIEVKYRSRPDFGGAAGSITNAKQQKIIKTAQVFMQQSQKFKNLGMRFDAMILQQSGDDINVNWIPSAFYTDAF
jgi:putative endonuclease